MIGYLTMMVFAQPSNFKGLGMVIVMGLHLGISTDFTRLLYDLPTLDVRMEIGTGIGLHSGDTF